MADHIPPGLRFSLALDGIERGVVAIDDVSARQVGELELLFSVSVERLVARLLAQEVSPLEAAALVYLAERQQGLQPDPDKLLDSIKLGSAFEVSFIGDVQPVIDPASRDADPEA